MIGEGSASAMLMKFMRKGWRMRAVVEVIDDDDGVRMLSMMRWQESKVDGRGSAR